MLPAELQQLENGHIKSRMLFHEARRNYVAERAGLLTELTSRGRFDPARAENLLKGIETLWLPAYDSFSSRGPIGADGMAAPNAEYLEAIRMEVGQEHFNRFTQSLRNFRLREHQDQRMTGQLAKYVEPERFARLEAQTSDIEGYRSDLADLVRQINPKMKLAGIERGFMSDADPESDPLAQTMTLSLDPAKFDQDKSIHRELFSSIASGLTEKEREVLDRTFGMATRFSRDGGKTWEEVPEGLSIVHDKDNKNVGTLVNEDGEIKEVALLVRTEPFEREKTIERASAAFVGLYAAKRRPDPLAERALKPFRDFFERSRNLLHFRGFQTAEDILKRARSGEIGERAANRAAKPGLRMPLPSDDPGNADRMRTAISKMTGQELALAIREQQTVLNDTRKKQYSIANSLFRYRAPINNLIRSGSPGAIKETAHGKSRGNAAFRKDRKELKELNRALAALKAEQRRRAGQEVSNILQMPDPGSRQQVPPMAPREDFDHQMRSKMRASMDSGDGRIAVASTASGKFDVTLHHPDLKNPVPLAAEATENGAYAMIQAFDRISNGPSSPTAERLAGELNRAGQADNADIKLLKNSNLIDKELDDAIGKRDLKAFVYPLKTGDVVFQLSDGTWHAGRRDEFIQAARQAGDRHMRAAADEIVAKTPNVVPFDRTRDGSPVSPSATASGPAKARPASSPDMSPEPPATPGRQQAPALKETLAMAASAGKAEPYKVPDSTDPRIKEAARKELADLSPDQLKARHKMTTDAHAALKNSTTPKDMRERRELALGKTALQEVMRAKGIEFFSAENKPETAVDQSHKRKAGPKR